MKQFGFKATETMYHLLSSGLYKNKIRAVVRELSTNAWDAHQMVNNNDPFDIHIPTTKNSYFIVRDHGPGLSEEGIYELYTTYGGSSKSMDDNSYNGMFGVGSKSPFAYANEFFVTSYHDGKKMEFRCFKDNLIPKIEKLGEEENNNPSGLEIKVPVEWEDISVFKQEIKYIFSFFTMKPRFFENDQEVELKLMFENLIEDVKNGKNVIEDVSYEEHKFMGGEKIIFIMGNVAYPYSPKDFEHKIYSFIDNYLAYKSKIFINTPIGAIDITGSRESAADTEKTRNFLKKYFDEILDGCNIFKKQTLFEKRIDDEGDIIKMFKSIKRIYESYKNVHNSLTNSLARRYLYIMFSNKMSDIRYHVYKSTDGDIYASKYFDGDLTEIITYVKHIRRNKTIWKASSDLFRIYLNNKNYNFIVRNDITSNRFTALKRFITQNYKDVKIISTINPGYYDEIKELIPTITYEDIEAEFQEFLNEEKAKRAVARKNKKNNSANVKKTVDDIIETLVITNIDEDKVDIFVDENRLIRAEFVIPYAFRTPRTVNNNKLNIDDFEYYFRRLLEELIDPFKMNYLINFKYQGVKPSEVKDLGNLFVTQLNEFFGQIVTKFKIKVYNYLSNNDNNLLGMLESLFYAWERSKCIAEATTISNLLKAGKLEKYDIIDDVAVMYKELKFLRNVENYQYNLNGILETNDIDVLSKIKTSEHWMDDYRDKMDFWKELYENIPEAKYARSFEKVVYNLSKKLLENPGA